MSGSGVYLPRRAVSAGDIDDLPRLPRGASERRFGLRRRCYAAPDETSSFMAAAAAEAALCDAGWQAADVDVLIGACGVMEQPIPAPRSSSSNGSGSVTRLQPARARERQGDIAKLEHLPSSDRAPDR